VIFTKKVLFASSVSGNIKAFQTPYLKLFKDNGYIVHVAAKWTSGDNYSLPYCDHFYNLSIERNPLKLGNINAIKELKRIILENKYECISCHTPMGGVVTRLASKKARKEFGTRVIYTAHGFHFYKGAPLLNWLIYYPIEWYLAKFTDTLITINTEDFELAKRKFSKRCKDIQYVPGVGIDTKKFDIKMTDAEKEEYRKSIGLSKEDYVLTCVARLDKNKNQGFLINVVEKIKEELSNVKLLLVGPDELNGYYQNMTKEKQLENQIIFLGMREDIPQLLQISDVVVSASKREGLPVNVMEAFACGKPFVALDCRGMKDLIENEKSGFVVDKNDITSFCKIIVNLKNDTDLLVNIKKNIFEISSKYDASNLIIFYRRIYFLIKR